jgi:hypothetical protein
LGEPGPLEHFAGPDEWQRQELIGIGRQVHDRTFDARGADPARGGERLAPVRFL